MNFDESSSEIGSKDLPKEFEDIITDHEYKNFQLKQC
jgi:hypothetical protein